MERSTITRAKHCRSPLSHTDGIDWGCVAPVSRCRLDVGSTVGKQKQTRNQGGAGPFCMHDLLKTPGRVKPDQRGMVYLFKST
ncbi:hypothetical protein Pan161_59410 [Gimesia algae]|uniref:Uncharacterized protein n=1 Tax=Gimesia algae TaxID=2527971 RepID=A0A517VML8_9PLAN|nr:hypothetical protein Pan161_59410 [Gimesia algae]